MSFRVVGIGEVLWDLLPSGPQLGGAPANFAYHAGQLGAGVQVITRVGRDAYGQKILQRFEEMNIDGGTVQLDDQLPTGTVNVLLNGGTPQFAIHRNVAWDALSSPQEALEAAQSASAIYFGTLAQRNKSAAAVIQRLIASTSSNSLRIFDVNLRQNFYSEEILKQSLEIANVLKLNDYELSAISLMFGLKGDVNQKIEQLVRRFDFRLVALTRAEKGSLLYQSGNWSDLPGQKMDIVDTVGAGDAFTAALVMGLLNQFDLEGIHRIAEEVASFVCSQQGATPVLPANLRTAFAPNCASV
jgi:fructokinase